MLYIMIGLNIFLAILGAYTRYIPAMIVGCTFVSFALLYIVLGV